MKVWRIHIKNDVADGYNRSDLLDFCLKEKLIGVGWGDIRTRKNDETEIREQAQVYAPDVTPAIKALNAMRKMKTGDLIWTRLDSTYYLCKVTNLWENSKPKDMHYKLDIPNYVEAEWIKIGMEQDVPGKVVSSFRPPASAQSISGVEAISMYFWNVYSKKKDYPIKKENIDIWTVLSAEAIEELVLLYLQVEKNYYIYSSTVKYAFPLYECLLVNKEGKHAYPQVKTGNDTLNADNYMNALDFDTEAEVYLFATSEGYKSNGNKHVHFLYRRDLETFVKKNKELLPKLTKYWIDLCGGFDKK